MSNNGFSVAAWAAMLLSAACVSTPPQPSQDYLSEDEVLNLMRHPKKWDGRTVRIRIFPFDNGFKTSYVVCFEKCSESYAERSPFIIITSLNRFAGYKGDRAVVVTATYSSACFYDVYALCGDNRFGEFTEIP